MIKVFLTLFSLVALSTFTACATAESNRLPFNPETISSPPTGETSFRFVAISDLNGSYGSTVYNSHVHRSIELIQSLRPEFVLSAGDLVAGQQRGLTDPEIFAMWDGLTEAVVAPLQKAGIPFAPVPGNHDASGYPPFIREREIFQEHWQKPAQKPNLEFVDDSNYPFYYSFRHKGAFFMTLDITTLEALPPELWDWMEDQLKNAQDATLRFASCHVPPYPISQGREHEIIRAPHNDRLRNLFTEHNLDVLFTGHHHAYFKARKEGLNLVSLNCAGSGPRPLIGTDSPQIQSFLLIDVVDGKIAELFAVQSDGQIFPDRSLPFELRHASYTLPRFDR